MIQTWEKLGRVYCAQADAPWKMSHAYLPTAFNLSPSVIRVFVAFMDATGMGRVGYVDVDALDPTRVVGVSEDPALDLGRPGRFDEHGISPLCLVQENDMLYLMYAGWQRAESVRYFLFTGMAMSDDLGRSFTRVSEAPILDRRDDELLVRTGGFAYFYKEKWIFAYMGGSDQIELAGKLTPTYDLKILTAASPMRWDGGGVTALVPKRPEEFGFGRPWVICEDGRCRMWFSIRSVAFGYHIAYAESLDGVTWKRCDDALSFTGVNEAWDSEMRSFPSIVDTAAGRFMFYNGNGYGATGFGVARLVASKAV